MLLIILFILIIVIFCFTSGSNEISKKEISKILKLLTHYKINASDYLRKKFNVSGKGRDLIKKICKKHNVATYEKFIELSEISQIKLLPADKQEFINESSYYPTESEYSILNRIVPRENIYDFWRTHKFFKIKNAFLKMSVEKLRKQLEPLEIDIIPFYAYSDKLHLEKECKLLESMLDFSDRQLKYKLLAAIIRNRQLQANDIKTELLLQHYKDVDNLVKIATNNANTQQMRDLSESQKLIKQDIENLKRITKKFNKLNYTFDNF